MAWTKGSKNHAIEDAKEASSHKEVKSNSQLNMLNEILEQLLPALVALLQTQQQILQF